MHLRCGSSYRQAIDHDAKVAIVVPAEDGQWVPGRRAQADADRLSVGRGRGDVGGNVDVVFPETAADVDHSDGPPANLDAHVRGRGRRRTPAVADPQRQCARAGREPADDEG